jgi:hypothetical protein
MEVAEGSTLFEFEEQNLVTDTIPLSTPRDGRWVWCPRLPYLRARCSAG